MKRTVVAVVVLVVLVASVLVTRPASHGFAQNEEAEATTTVIALQTRVAAAQQARAVATQVAELSTRVSVLETQAAGPASSPTEEAQVAVGHGPGGSLASPSAGTPVASSNGIDVLYTYTMESSYGSSYVYGELYNGTDAISEAPSISATFFDADGKIVDTVSLSPVISLIAPGDTIGFSGYSTESPDAWTRYTIEVYGGGPASDTTIGSRASGLEIRNINEVEKTDKRIRVLGEVFNGGSRTATSVGVKVLLYRSDGRFAGTGYASFNGGDLAPGDSGSFKVDGSIDVGPDWTYRLLPDAAATTTVPVPGGSVEVVDGTEFAGEPPTSRAGVDLVYFYSQPGIYGGSALYGELRNSGDQSVSTPYVYLTFYDADGKIVDSTYTTGAFGLIEPGASVPIQGSTGLEPEEWASYRIVLNTASPATSYQTSNVAKGLEVRNASESSRTETSISIVGEVHNAGDTSAKYLQVVILFYRADGRFSGYTYTSLDIDIELAPGKNVAFKLSASVAAGTDWTYQLVARGNPVS
jgi:hypothetical protein